MVLLSAKFLVAKRKPWLDLKTGFHKIIHLTVLETLVLAKIIFELFNTYGIANSYSGKLKEESPKFTPSLLVTVLDKLGEG